MSGKFVLKMLIHLRQINTDHFSDVSSDNPGRHMFGPDHVSLFVIPKIVTRDDNFSHNKGSIL